MSASGKLLYAAASAVIVAIAAMSSRNAPANSAAQSTFATLPGHVLPMLDRANPISSSSDAPLTITFVLNRDDEAGFQRYLQDVYDPSSPNFRRFMTAAQLAQQFGPSPENYARVSDFATSQHLSVTTTSSNRMTLTATGSRAAVENAFAVRIGDFKLGDRTFFANRESPSLPSDIAPHVNAVLGLSDLAQAAHAEGLTQGQKASPSDPSLAYTCEVSGDLDNHETAMQAAEKFFGRELPGGAAMSVATTVLHYQCAADELDLITAYYANLVGSRPAGAAPSLMAASQPSGGGQTVALAEFDSYQTTDVLAFLNFIGYPERMSQLSNFTIGAGPNFTLQGESEVLLDIDTVLTLAPGATVVTYSAGFKGQGSFQTMFNAMIGNSVDVISNSWAYCEDQTTLADVQSLNSVLQTAAAAGITVLTGAGDSGSTCLDGAANTIAVPADVPSITAVGGTSATPGVDGTYGSETWWDGTQQTPPSGQGGFGVSRYFARPSYQSGVNAQANRSIPDVSAPADPAQGVLICEADNGGCPTDIWYGGTSIAAPIWAASMAVLNQRSGQNFGFLNPQIYPFANGSAFHSGASMGSDFTHVGLGSPNFSELRRRLLNGTLGAATAAHSAVVAFPPLTYADNTSQVGVSVIAMDANFNAVPGQSVTLSANVGSHATITAINATSNADNGAARFIVTDNTAETITLTAKFGATALSDTAQIQFVGARAASGGIVASPTTQTADGVSTSTITVSLKDAQNRPAANKQVTLAQNANSVILGSNPQTTDNNGEAQFDVTDQVAETAVYTAIDVTDYDVPVPGSASVDFNSAAANACGNGAAPLAGPGYAISTYASGFPVRNGVTFGNITLNGCVGVTGIAFDSAQNLYAADYVTGDVYKFPVGGGIAGAGNKLTGTAIGTSLGSLAFGDDGTLYGTRVATSVSATTGAVLKIDTLTGAATTLVSNLNCPSDIKTDPISGDLFVADFCFGNAQESDAILRIGNLQTASPSVSTYAHTGILPTGSLSFASDGTLYAVYGYPSFPGLFAGIDSIGATNGAQPAPVTPIGVQSTFSALALGNNPSGGAQTMIVSNQTLGGYAHSVAAFDLTVTPPVFSGTTLVTSDIGSTKLLGRDQCLYLANGNAIYKITNDDGSCPLTGLAPNPSLVLTPESNPAAAVQGTPLRFDVTFPHNPNLPLGTNFSYEIHGANTAIGSTVDAVGSVSFAYTGVYGGIDKVSASTVIGGVEVTSNVVIVNWSSGKHTTFLDLNRSVLSASIGSTQTVSAVLFDQSATPFAPIAGATVTFTIAGQSCAATTDANGKATCGIAISAGNECTLSAAYDGSSQFLASSASELFSVSSVDVLFANGFEIPQAAGCSRY